MVALLTGSEETYSGATSLFLHSLEDRSVYLKLETPMRILKTTFGIALAIGLGAFAYSKRDQIAEGAGKALSKFRPAAA